MSFWSDSQNFVFPLVTLAVGIIGNKLFDDWSQQRRLYFERQQKLIDAQSALLDELARVSWKFRFDAIKVAYYSKNPDEEKYTLAVKNYQKNCWDSLSELRFTATQAGRLFGKSDLDRVEAFYQIVNDLDSRIEKAIAEDDLGARTTSFEQIYTEIDEKLREEIADIIFRLAKRFDLTPKVMKSSEEALSSSFIASP